MGREEGRDGEGRGEGREEGREGGREGSIWKFFPDGKSDVEGQSVDLGGGRIIKKKKGIGGTECRKKRTK